MSAERPDFHDADLILRLYDLRREPVMRESRTAMLRDFQPRSYDELKTIASTFDHPLNAPWRQVSSYWEMCYGFVRHGIINAELLLETGGEGLFIFAKVQPFLEQFRAEFSPFAFQNAEWLVRNTTAGTQRFEVIKKRLEAMMKSR